MKLTASWCWALWGMVACRDQAAPTAPPPSPPEAQEAPAPALPNPNPSPPAASAPNPCDAPAVQTLELAAGIATQTPWDVELRYVVDDDKKLGSGYVFQLRSGERRWETRRNNRNWNQPITWRGFCWRGAERPKPKSLQLKIQIAPVCKDGKLQELGGCGNALGVDAS